ncbi:MAG: oligosaccharide flippase family protein [bacterium]
MLKRLLKTSSLYALGDLITRGMNFFLLPIYTAFLTPEDFGIIGIANVLAMMFPIVFTLGIRGAALKFYYDYQDEQERRTFYGTIWIFSIVLPTLGYILIEFAGRSFHGSLFEQVPFDPYLHLTLLIGFLTAVFVTIPRELFRAAERPTAYSSMNLGVFLLSTAFTFWLVVGLKRGAEGALLAKVLGNVVVAVPLGVFLVRYVRIRFDTKMFRRALAYSIPMIPHMLSLWLLASVGRLILERHVPLADVGRFNFAFTLSSVLFLLASAMNNALIPVFGNLVRGDELREKNAARASTYLVAMTTGLALPMYLFMPEALHLLTPPSYHGAAGPFPLLLLGFLFNALYTIPANVLTLGAGNSRIIGVSTITAAVLNVGLNLLLVPKFGVMGAALTHAITYAVFFAICYYFAQRILPLHYEYFNIGVFLLIAAGGIPVNLALHYTAPLIAIGVKVVYLTAALLIVLRYRKRR